MVRIRLRRVGRKKQPSFRLVATEKESPRDGRFIEVLGFYNPRTEPATIQLQEDRIYEWLDKGAQPSDGAEKVLRSISFYDRYERHKKGEDLEKLLAEAAAEEATRSVSPKTRREPPTGTPKKKKAEEPAKEKPEAEAEAPEPEAAQEEPAQAEEATEEPAAEEPAETEAAEEEPTAEEASEPEAAEEVPAQAEEETEEPAAEEETAEEPAEEQTEETEK